MVRSVCMSYENEIRNFIENRTISMKRCPPDITSSSIIPNTSKPTVYGRGLPRTSGRFEEACGYRCCAFSVDRKMSRARLGLMCGS